MSAYNPVPTDPTKSSIIVTVVNGGEGGKKEPVSGALVGLYVLPAPSGTQAAQEKAREEPFNPSRDEEPTEKLPTDANGKVEFKDLDARDYAVVYLHLPITLGKRVLTHAGCTAAECLEPAIGAQVETHVLTADCKEVDCRAAQVGDVEEVRVKYAPGMNAQVNGPPGAIRRPDSTDGTTIFSSPLNSVGSFERPVSILLPLRSDLAFLAESPGSAHGPAVGAGFPGGAQPAIGPAALRFRAMTTVGPRQPIPVSGNLGISLTRTETEPTPDLPLWTAIRNGTDALSFNNYQQFIELLFCTDNAPRPPGADRYDRLKQRRFLPFTDTDSYRVLKVATEAFVMVNCNVLTSNLAFSQDDADLRYFDRRDLPLIANLPDQLREYFVPLIGGARLLPYLALIQRKLPDIQIRVMGREDADLCAGFIQNKLQSPCLIELIWSYWNEEAMLVQTLNAITRRFQNVRSPITPDPLANVEIDPLRPLNNLLWGYTQDEQHRLTVNRRNYEYDHHYGLRLHGRAVQLFRPADTRSQFLEAFHHLLRLCTSFFRQDDDTTIKADAFPVLNALKEVHLVMSEGAHNQFGDLPSTARIEMLMQQWLLARPEFREFLPTRLMVAYPEAWMDRVDAMKKLQGWTDTSVVHFRNLAIFGEQLLLTIRYGAWSEIFEPTQAFNWARFWRPQIQGYIHAYRAATGVDLSGDTGDVAADATVPSLLLQRRLTAQRTGQRRIA